MKKLFIFLTMLVLGIVSSWATDVTVTINDQTDLAGITNASTSEATATHKYGTYSGSDEANKPYYTTFTSNSTSGLADVTISTTAKILKPTYVSSSFTTYQHVMAIFYDKTDNTTEYIFTISAPANYYIKNYSFVAVSTSDGGPFIITPLGGSAQEAKGYYYRKTVTATVNASTATFKVKRNSNNNASTLCIPQFTVTLASIPTYDATYTPVSINNSTGSLDHVCGGTSTSWYCRWISSEAEGIPAGLTLTTSDQRNNMKWNSSNIDIHSANNPTYTLTAPSGYVISGYTMALYADSPNSQITPTGCSTTIISTTSSNPTYICVTGLSTKSTTFTRTGTSIDCYATTFIVYLHPTVEINYVVKDNGGSTIYRSSSVEIEKGQTITTLPSKYHRDFCSYNEVSVTADKNKDVDFTATWDFDDFPFEISNTYEDAHWYDMSVRSTWYVTSDNTDSDGALKTVNANAFGLVTDPYQWAFVGTNPYNIKLYNKYKGNEYVYSWSSTDNESIPGFVSAATGNPWAIKASTASGYTDAFMLTIPDYGYQVNQFGGKGGSLKIWNSTGTGDDGSAFNVFDVPDDFAEYVTSEIAPYMENSATYFNWTDAARETIGYNESYKTSCPYVTYASMKSALASALSNLNSNVNFPPAGYYRIKSKLTTGNYGYMGLNGTALVGNISNANDASTIIHLTKSGDKYYFQIQGKYTGSATESTVVNLVDVAPSEAFAMDATAIGYAAFRTLADEDYSYYHAAKSNSYQIVGWERAADASQWSLEDATSFSGTLTNANDNTGTGHSYATVCVPFAISSITGASAYAPSIDGSSLDLGDALETPIAAGTPVILIGATDAGSYTANIKTDATPVSSPTTTNALTGTFTGTSIDCTATTGTNYVLGFDSENENRIGFYHVNSSSYNLKANRAYLSTSGENARGFYISFADDATGIDAPNGETAESAAIYNLSGQRLNKMQKGINIVNGKKVLF